MFAARVPLAGRDSLAVEEGMPPFVLDVVSSSSMQRDLEETTELYRQLGAREYALVRLDLAVPRLEGYRRDETRVWTVWAPDAEGRLWNGVLGLGLLLCGSAVRAVTREDEVSRTPREEAEGRQQEAQARAQAEAAWAVALVCYDWAVDRRSLLGRRAGQWLSRRGPARWSPLSAG